MEPRGLAEVERAGADGHWEAAYAPASTATVPEALAEALAADREAKCLTGTNRYAVLYRIGAVKRPETRARKIAELVVMLARRDPPRLRRSGLNPASAMSCGGGMRGID